MLSRESYQRYHRLILELALGGLSGYARCSTGCASLRSVLDTIDIFRIAPTQLAAHSNSRLRSCLKVRPKRACYGGLNTAMDDIVDRAHGLILDAVGARLRPNTTSLS